MADDKTPLDILFRVLSNRKSVLAQNPFRGPEKPTDGDKKKRKKRKKPDGSSYS